MRIAHLSLVLVCLGVPAAGQDAGGTPDAAKPTGPEITFLAGSDYVSGDIDGNEYETIAFNAGLSVRSDRLSLTASIPYVMTTAPEDLIVGKGGVLGTPLFSQPTTQTREVTRKGIGDLAVQAGYSFPLASVDGFIAANVKIPTASRAKALGTGEFDYGVSGQLSRRFGRAIPFTSASYTVIGEPEGFETDNIAAASVGSHFLVGAASSVSIAYNFEESATAVVDDSHSVGIGLDTDLGSKIRLGAEARAGLSSDAPDARIGLRVGIGF